MDWLVFTSSFDYFPSWQAFSACRKVYSASVECVECNYIGTTVCADWWKCTAMLGINSPVAGGGRGVPGLSVPTPGYHPTDHC